MAPTKPLDHETCRTKVCLICLRKSAGMVNSAQIEKIRKSSSLFKSIHPMDKRVPNGICEACRRDLNRANPALKIPDGFSYSKDVVVPANTRQNSGDSAACPCLICEIGKYNKPFLPHPYYKVPLKQIFKVGVKRKSEPEEKFQWNNNLSIHDNLNRLQEKNPRQIEQFAGQVIKKKESSPGGTKYFTQMFGGKPFPVSLGKKQKIEKALFTHDEMEDLSTKHHMSQRQIRDLQHFINRKPQCKFEPGLQKELPIRNKLLDDFYTGEHVYFQTSDDPKKSEVIKRPMVYCKSAQELIFEICEIRDIDWHLFKIQVFLDGGGDMLKMSCVIKPVIPVNEKAGRKSSGVNQLIPLAFCPKCPENYPNFRIFFEKTLIWAVKFFMSVDLKVKNIVSGIQNAAAYFPCGECTTPQSDFHTCEKTGDTRTVSDLANEYERFKSDQAKRKDGKDYHNVIHLPLFDETLEEMKAREDLKVNHILPPSPLHYNLGVVPLFHKEMEKRWPEAVKNWEQKSHVKRSDNPKMRFEGNDCIKLLENSNVFYDNHGTAKNGEMIPYLNVLSSFNEMRKVSFNCDDPIDVDLCREKIEKFTRDSKVLIKDFEVNAINKLHACHVHLMEWIEEFKMGLGNVDEQTGESSHHDFKKFCQGRLIEDIDDPRYLECLRKLVVEYASKHRKSELCF